jgi:hypothetical protein
MLELLAALALPLLATTSGTCVDPAITSAVASLAGNSGDLTTYDVAVKITNGGHAAEPSSLLQSVAVFQDTDKVGQIGTPPLKPAASTTVHYRFQRSSEARTGSTHLRFSLVVTDPHTPVSDCSSHGRSYRIDV